MVTESARICGRLFLTMATIASVGTSGPKKSTVHPSRRSKSAVILAPVECSLSFDTANQRAVRRLFLGDAQRAQLIHLTQRYFSSQFLLRNIDLPFAPQLAHAHHRRSQELYVNLGYRGAVNEHACDGRRRALLVTFQQRIQVALCRVRVAVASRCFNSDAPRLSYCVGLKF